MIPDPAAATADRMRPAVFWYIWRKSVGNDPSPPVPQAGVRTEPPMPAGRGSFLRSNPTSGLAANRSATMSQVLVKTDDGQLSLYHRPLTSASEQHAPGYSRWQFSTAYSPAAVMSSTRTW